MHQWDLGAARALVATLAGDPDLDGGQFAAQGLDLADCTTLFMTVFIKTEQALVTSEFFQRLPVGREQFQIDRVVFANRIDKAVGLGVQSTGVEGEELRFAL